MSCRGDTDADGTTEEKTYDAMGNLTSETNTEGETTRYAYDGADRLVKTTYHDGSFTETEYDAAGRTVSTTDAKGNSVSYTYDAAGNQLTQTDDGNTLSFTYDAQGNRLTMTSPSGEITTYEYNSLNQRIRTTYPDGTTVQEIKNISGLPVQKITEDGNVITYEYDTTGTIPLLNKVILPNGATTTYGYDSQGRKTSQTDALGRTIRWTYTPTGELLSETLPMGQTKTFTYDQYGKQSQVSDYANKTTRFVYDSNDKLVRTEYADGTHVTYDYTPAGRIKTLTDAQGSISYTYDNRGRVRSETNPSGETITYGYDAVGNIVQIQTPGRTITKTYTARNQLKSVTDRTGTTTYDYDALGRQTTVTYPNGTTTRYTYDSKNRVTKLEHRDSVNSVLQSFAYTLDSVGNRTQVIENTGRTVDYTYDDLNRLTGETVSNDPNGNDTQTTFTYDDVGNMLTRTIDGIETTYVYNENDQLIQQGTTAFTYDDNGNLIQKENETYAYDDKNRLIQVTTATDTVEYAYDANDNRIAKSVNGITTSYLIDANTQYAQVISESTEGTTTEYTYGNDLITDGSSFFLTDALGSTRGLVDQTEQLTDTYSYTPYGELVDHEGTSENGFLYTGERFDQETENYYLRARYYSPGMSRFVGRDTYEGVMENPLTQNHYLYGNANPITYVDPTGNFGVVEATLAVTMLSYANLVEFFPIKSVGTNDSMKDILMLGAQDGHLTLAEATGWYRYGDGKSLVVDGSRLFYMRTGQTNKQKGTYPAIVVGYNDYAVHGQVTINESNSHIYDGKYDFDMHGNFLRDLPTIFGRTAAGDGKEYEICYRYKGEWKTQECKQ